MSKIRLLNEHTINQIAAGEVIENTSSVVKELVENSIDAGATEIYIEIKQGGRQLIKIIDNGCGMDSDDALLCLERHATSKIKQVDDIHAITSMGFRGEAIPSIAAISKFTLLTRLSDSPNDQGTLVQVDGGKVMECSPVVCSKGTTIEVKSLFFNVPVRKKFQRSPAYDANEILKVATLLSLAHPQIAFQLVHNGEALLSTSKFIDNCNSLEALEERVRSVLGASFLSTLRPVEAANGDFKIRGFIGLPSETRQNRTGQYLFINKRAVFSPLISSLVKSSYGTTIPTQRHPVFILAIDVPGDFVDVNVHPQKKEVRLRQEQVLKNLIRESIEGALQHSGFTVEPQFSYYSEPLNFELREETAQFYSSPVAYQPLILEKEESKKEKHEEHEECKEEASIRSGLDLSLDHCKGQQQSVRVLNTIPGYILVDPESLHETPMEGLGLVNQRAAHFRVLYEQLFQKEQLQSEVQPLLIPHQLELTPLEADLIKQHLSAFQSMGIGITEFGKSSFLIDAIPRIFNKIDIKLLFLDLLNKFKEQPGVSPFEQEKEKWLAYSACKSAIQKNAKLSFEEAIQLVSRLMRCKCPYFCPYGRPTIKVWNKNELAKMFES